MKHAKLDQNEGPDISTPLGAPSDSFKDLLRQKIDYFRPNIVLDKDIHKEGRRYNDSNYIVDAIIDTVILAFKERLNGLDVIDLPHLDFNEHRINNGEYNNIIKQMIEISARNDYTVEIDPHLH